MNYFTRQCLIGGPASIRKLVEGNSEISNFCEHTAVDKGLTAVIAYECDSFGREGTALCQVCADQQRIKEGQVIVSCHDCGKMLPMAEMNKWTPYDFNPADGDQPLYVCDNCIIGDAHNDRVARNAAEYELEFGDPDIDCD